MKPTVTFTAYAIHTASTTNTFVLTGHTEWRDSFCFKP